MKQYELTYTIPPDLSPEESEKILEEVNSYLPSPPKKKEVGYFLVNLEFDSEPEKIGELEKKIKAESQILRFMITKKGTSKMPARISKRMGRRPPKEKPGDERPEEKAKKKAELGEIDKKLEEIFGESSK